MKLFLYGALLATLMILSCNATAVSTPTPELPSPAPPSPTAEILEASDPPDIEPPEGFKKYQDSQVGVSVFMPESWVVSEVDPGRFAILQSYPEGKYVGGEAFEPGDTKCDLAILPPDIGIADALQQLKSDPMATITSEQEIVLQSGKMGTRIDVESMGRSLSLITDVNARAIVLTCFGELAPFDEIAITLGGSE